MQPLRSRKGEVPRCQGAPSCNVCTWIGDKKLIKGRCIDGGEMDENRRGQSSRREWDQIGWRCDFTPFPASGLLGFSLPFSLFQIVSPASLTNFFSLLLPTFPILPFALSLFLPLWAQCSVFRETPASVRSCRSCSSRPFSLTQTRVLIDPIGQFKLGAGTRAGIFRAIAGEWMQSICMCLLMPMFGVLRFHIRLLGLHMHVFASSESGEIRSSFTMSLPPWLNQGQEHADSPLHACCAHDRRALVRSY